MTFRTGVAGYWVTAVLATAATTACGDATAPAPEPGPPGLHIVSGATGRDTVLAWLSEPLVVVVRDADGLPLVGESVRYATTWQGSETPSALVAAEPGTLAHDVHTATTDRAGTARAAIRLGARAGPAAA